MDWTTVPIGRPASGISKNSELYNRFGSTSRVWGHDALALATECFDLADSVVNQPTNHRRTTLLAIIFLGAGAVITRSSARDITAADLRTHSSREKFVWTGGYCAKVRPEFVELATELIALCPTGRLRGTADPSDVGSHATAWLTGRRGVPALSVDRLRATYLCAFLSVGVGLVDILNWSGLASAEALDGYVQHAAAAPHVCEHPSGRPS
jgi:hypothetical protein